MLDQLNPVVLQIDSLMTHSVIPSDSSVLHSSSVDINLWNKITIAPKMEWNNNRIGDLITEMDNHKTPSFTGEFKDAGILSWGVRPTFERLF